MRRFAPHGAPQPERLGSRDIARVRRFAVTALVAFVASTATGQQTASFAGHWQYLQPPDKEGEILVLLHSSGRWRGIMNGLERTGEHGLFYYVVEVENLVVDPNGSIRFEVGNRSYFRKRPALSDLAGRGDGGFARSRMHFAGRMEGRELILRCEDEDRSCPDSTLRFKRLARTLEPDHPLQARPDGAPERR